MDGFDICPLSFSLKATIAAILPFFSFISVIISLLKIDRQMKYQK